ncbi:hypothetical protein J3998_02020 [Thiomicrorhabdus sp. 6S2-11]|uniref:Uncharacterized protein n=1 Tax=Thiomicrorhabdus marina TaxID=2818442 RepID=A0ABS3Q239_9GAMM|nr:hypothetical protein [Thiomicrorhabdus marina]MBO1926341.1 hypothetical protein [Thiomicrorhabdus marina]
MTSTTRVILNEVKNLLPALQIPPFIRNDIRIRHPERSRGISNQQQDASTGSA